MPVIAGKCMHCGEPTWRSWTDPRTGDTVLLWPMPTSRYLRVRTTPDAQGNTHVAVGIGVCLTCCPATDDPMPADVLTTVRTASHLDGVETAHTRYRYWYSAQYGEWLRAHARDQFKMGEDEIEKLLAQWERDRAA